MRWRLFFLRTLALYAARIALVASCVLINKDAWEPAEVMLGAGDPVISRRGRCEVEWTIEPCCKRGSGVRGSNSTG